MLYTGKFIGKTLNFTGCSMDYVTQEYVDWLNNPQINRFLETRFVTQTLDTVSEYVQNVIKSSNEWLFAALDGDKHIGNLHLTVYPRHNYCFIGYFIGDASNWGHGRSIEINQFSLQFSFEKLGVDRVEGGAYASNIFSIKAMLQAGFIQEGIRRKSVILRDGKRDDSYVLGILREEYDALNFEKFTEVL